MVMTEDIYSEKILILDFGSQYTQLIARRVREAQVYCEIHPFNFSLEKIKAFAPKGIILSGGPASVYDRDSPLADKAILSLPVPFLGICYGMQYLTYVLNGLVERADDREYGSALISIQDDQDLFHGFDTEREEMAWITGIGFIVYRRVFPCWPAARAVRWPQWPTPQEDYSVFSFTLRWRTPPGGPES